MKVNLSHLSLLTILTNFGSSSDILVILPLPALSHIINFMPIVKGLAAKGHNVTMVSPFPQKVPIANITDIEVTNILDLLVARTHPKDIQDMNNIYYQLFGFWAFGINGLPIILECEAIKTLIADKDSNFDLIIAETFFIQEPLVAFGHKFNAPVINLIPAFLFPLAAHLTGNHLPVSYVPLLKLGYNDHMTFWERVLTSFFYYWDFAFGGLYYLNKMDAMMREHFKYPGSENLPPLVDMLRNTSLTLMDYNHATGYPAPLHRNVIPFGGISIQESQKLPPDLQSYLDNAKDGVIYFSLGSFFSLTQFTPEIQKEIFSALGKVKQKVLMKLDNPKLLEKYSTKNIEIRTWFPQPSILAHPNCKLFITHGGIHGIMEGTYHAVPMLVLPIAVDQIYNARFIETVEIGYTLELSEINEKNILFAINALLSDPLYRVNIKERSAIFKDTPMDTLDNVIYWIEYVMRYKGAPHLRPAVLDLYWYQYLMLDVIVFYLLIMGLTIFVLKSFVKFLLIIIRILVFRKSTLKLNKIKSKNE